MRDTHAGDLYKLGYRHGVYDSMETAIKRLRARATEFDEKSPAEIFVMVTSYLEDFRDCAGSPVGTDWP